MNSNPNSHTALRVFSCALCALLSLPGCAPREADPKTADSEELRKVLAGIENESMRELWRAAYQAGKLPDLDTLPQPDPERRVTRRRRPARLPAGGTGATPVPPVIDTDTLADVEFFAPTFVGEYRGPFRITDSSPGRIVGRAPGRTEPWEIIYKLPSVALLALPRDSTGLELIYRVEAAGGSVHERLHLLSAGGEQILFYLADGDRTPYARSFKEIPLAVRQGKMDGRGAAPVTVRLGNQERTLRPGGRARLSLDHAELEVVLMVSFFTKPSESLQEEGNPYYVNLVIYRLAP